MKSKMWLFVDGKGGALCKLPSKERFRYPDYLTVRLPKADVLRLAETLIRVAQTDRSHVDLSFAGTLEES